MQVSRQELAVWFWMAWCVGDAMAEPTVERPQLTVGVVAQLRGEVGWADGEPTLDVRVHRLRPSLRANAGGGAVGLSTQLNATPGNLEVLDVVVDARLRQEVRVRVGQFKIPFTAYRLRSFQSMVLADWSITARAFGGERQWGVAAGGNHDAWRWSAGLFTGRNQRAAHAVRLPELYGRQLANPSALVEPGPPASSVHPELVVHAGRYADGLDPRSGRDPHRDGRWRLGIAGSAALDARPVRGEDFAGRMALDCVLQGHGVGLVAVVATGWAPTEEGWRAAMHSGLLETSVGVHRRVAVASRVALNSTTRALRQDVAQAEGSTPWHREVELGGAVQFELHDVLVATLEVAYARTQGQASSDEAVTGPAAARRSVLVR